MTRAIPGASLAWMLLLLVMPSCVSLSSGATETFSAEHACAESQVTSLERSDLAASTFMAPKDDDVRAFLDDTWTVIEARGCGADVLYACAHPFHGRRGMDFRSVSCLPLKALGQPP